MTNGIYNKKLRARWKKLGLCTTCGHEREHEDIATCNSCKERRKDYYAKNKDKCKRKRDVWVKDQMAKLVP